MFIAAFSSVMLLKVVNLKFEYILVFEVIFGVLMMILITKDKSESDANQLPESLLKNLTDPNYEFSIHDPEIAKQILQNPGDDDALCDERNIITFACALIMHAAEKIDFGHRKMLEKGYRYNSVFTLNRLRYTLRNVTGEAILACQAILDAENIQIGSELANAIDFVFKGSFEMSRGLFLLQIGSRKLAKLVHRCEEFKTKAEWPFNFMDYADYTDNYREDAYLEFVSGNPKLIATVSTGFNNDTQYKKIFEYFAPIRTFSLAFVLYHIYNVVTESLDSDNQGTDSHRERFQE